MSFEIREEFNNLRLQNYFLRYLFLLSSLHFIIFYFANEFQQFPMREFKI